MIERQAADRPAASAQQAGVKLRQPGQRDRIAIFVAGSDIGVNQRRTDADEPRRRLAYLAKNQIALPAGPNWRGRQAPGRTR